MEKAAEIVKFIQGNMFLYAIVMAIVLPFAVILVGYMIHLFGALIAELLSVFVDPFWVNLIINYLFFPGVMIHEMSHALFAIITGAKLTEVKLFKKQGDTLGHVNIKTRGSKILVSIQQVCVAAAPMFVGTMVVWGCLHVLLTMPVIHIALKILVGYVGVSMFFFMTMSGQDIKVYMKGVPVFMLLIFFETLILRLFGVI